MRPRQTDRQTDRDRGEWGGGGGRRGNVDMSILSIIVDLIKSLVNIILTHNLAELLH